MDTNTLTAFMLHLGFLIPAAPVAAGLVDLFKGAVQPGPYYKAGVLALNLGISAFLAAACLPLAGEPVNVTTMVLGTLVVAGLATGGQTVVTLGKPTAGSKSGKRRVKPVDALGGKTQPGAHQDAAAEAANMAIPAQVRGEWALTPPQEPGT